MWGDVVVAVVAEGIGGDVADGGFGEVGWEGGAGGEEEFVGAAGVFDARPDVVAGAEVEEGFEEVAVFNARVVSILREGFCEPQRRVFDQLLEWAPSAVACPKGRLYMMDAVWRC